jgi:hypothetical protein
LSEAAKNPGGESHSVLCFFSRKHSGSKFKLVKVLVSNDIKSLLDSSVNVPSDADSFSRENT